MESSAGIETWVITILSSYGLAGLVMGAMGFIIRALWKDNITLRTTVFDIGMKATEANAATANALNLLRSDILSGRAKGGN
jgi:hypothetical protein